VSPPGTGPDPAGSRRGLYQLVNRLGWGVADQAVSSLSNFALGLFVVKAFGAEGLGAFTIAFVTYSVVLNASRGLSTDPLLVRFSNTAPATLRRAVSASAATALIVGTAVGAVCVLGGLFLPQPLGPVFLALGVGLPGILLQDSWRFGFFAGGRPGTALVNDLIWTLLMVLTLAGLHLTGTGSVTTCMAVFGATASLTGIVGALQSRTRPRISAVGAWARTHRDLSVRYLVENVSISGASQLRSFVLGGAVSLAALGHVRATEMLMGPFVVILMGICQVAIPEASRVLHSTPSRLGRFCFLLGAAQAAGAVVWGAAVLLTLPLGPGQLLLGEAWRPAAPLVVPVALAVAAGCFSTAATAGLRAMGAARSSLRAQLIASAVYVVGGCGGALLGAAAGACWGGMAANTLGALVWWYHLRVAGADHRPSLIGATR
jgi:O-antigen/teichoic acid export membrane protein